MKLLQIIIAFLCLPVIAQAKGFNSANIKSTEQATVAKKQNSHKSKVLTFTTDKKINAVYVYDESGKLVRSANGSDVNIQLDVRSLANGTYYMHVLCDGEKRIEEFVKE